MNNNNNNQENNSIIKDVLTQWGGYCNICGAKRSAENIKVVRRTEEMVVMHINCESCKNGHFISISYNSPTFTMQSYMSDLLEDEIDKLNNSPISMDDLIDAHLALNKVKTSEQLLNLINKK